MRIIICFFYVVLFSYPVVAQEEKEKWFGFETSVTGDFYKTLDGGISNDYVYLGMEDVMLSFDLEKMGLWKGGEVFVQGLNTHGRLPSEELTGDMQVVSNIESGDYTGVYQYFLSQNIGDWTFLIGQHDLNSEFVGTEYGGTFVNSSFGVSPTISLNVPVSIYPIAALAFVAKYDFQEKYCFKLGVYDGDPGDSESNRYNLQPNISDQEGALIISEFERSLSFNGNPDKVKLGGYYHTNKFIDYTDTLEKVDGNFGLYSIIDFVLWSSFAKPDRYFGLFAQGGLAPSNINQVNYYVGGGIHMNGILNTSKPDALGLAFAYANVSKPYRKLNTDMTQGELVLELTYKLEFLDRYFLQPNIQYIMNPGASSTIHDALVALMRFNIYLN
jgi:porin